jgi:hypothetical protein
MWFCSLLNGATFLGDHVCLTWMLGILMFRMEQALRRPLRRHELPPPLLENAELRAIVHDPLPPVEEEINPTVMMLLEADREEIDGKNANSTSQKHIKLEHTNDRKRMRSYNIWKTALE